MLDIVAHPADLHFSDGHPNAEVRVPTLAGVLATKAAAATDPRTASGIRHAQDVGFLLTMVSDPFDLRVELISGDTKTLEAMNGQVEDDRSAMWKFLDEKQRDLARSAYRILVS